MVAELRGRAAPARNEAANALAEMPYGLYVVGSRMGDDLNGMMAHWVMQVSFTPRLIAVAIENDARTLMNIRASGVFTVNLLAEDGINLAAKFAQPYYGSKIRGRAGAAVAEIHHKLEAVDYRLGEETGCPILKEALAWFECQTVNLLPISDHVLAVGRVLNAAVERDAEPLTTSVTGWPYSG